MTTPAPVANVAGNSVSVGDVTYTVQALDADRFTILLAGVPVGRIVYTFGAANGVPESAAITEEQLTAIAEVWFAAVDG